MAHYDCDNCGHSGGISYGKCERCTPSWVQESRKELNGNINRAKAAVEEHFATEIATLAGRKKNMLDALIEEHKDEHNLTYQAGRDWYKNKETA